MSRGGKVKEGHTYLPEVSGGYGPRLERGRGKLGIRGKTQGFIYYNLGGTSLLGNEYKLLKGYCSYN